VKLVLISNRCKCSLFHFFTPDEANAFIRANDKVGKALELAYEQVREQDLNEIEDRIRRRMMVYRR
jgi:cobalamin biosynthesis protein CbiD